MFVVAAVGALLQLSSTAWAVSGELPVSSPESAPVSSPVSVPVSSPVTEPEPRQALVGGEVASTKRRGVRDTTWVVSPRLFGDYRLGSGLTLEGTWGAAITIDTGADDSRVATFTSSNLFLGLRYEAMKDAESTLSLSVGATAPLAILGHSANTGQRRAGLGLAAAMRGLWDPWLWAPEQTGVTVGAIYERAWLEGVRVRVEGDLGATVNVGTATTDLGDLYAQLASELIASSGPVDLGLRLQGVWITADRAAMQLALAPYLAARVAQATLRAQFLLNLDEPLGIIGDGFDVWGILVSAEASL